MRAKHPVIVALSPTRTGDTPDHGGQTCHPNPVWSGILRLLKRREPEKTAYVIADWTGHSLRTVRRWMAGDTVPGVDVAFDLIRTDHGPAIIELIARSLPPKERAAFFRDLMKVAQRAELQARLEELGGDND